MGPVKIALDKFDSVVQHIAAMCVTVQSVGIHEHLIDSGCGGIDHTKTNKN